MLIHIWSIYITEDLWNKWWEWDFSKAMIITLFVTRIYWQILFSPSSKYFHINSQRQLVIFLLSIISSAGQHNLSHNHTLCMKGEAKSICLPNDYVKVMLRIAYDWQTWKLFMIIILFQVWASPGPANHCVNWSGYQGYSQSFGQRLCNHSERVLHCQVARLASHSPGRIHSRAANELSRNWECYNHRWGTYTRHQHGMGRMIGIDSYDLCIDVPISCLLTMG